MPSGFEDKEIWSVGEVLNDQARPLKERFRALFTLKNIGGSLAIELIQKGFRDPSALLKHELAYCLGQMQDSRAIPTLVQVLRDHSQEPMVRHEAGEALGAIGDPSVIPILEEYSKDSTVEVAETCELALKRLKWIEEKKKNDKTKDDDDDNPYDSVDPAPPVSLSLDVGELSEVLLDEKKSLFERYRAMFSLRNLRTKEGALALSKGLKAKESGALFRHEIAFVLGQLQEEASVPYLEESLTNEEENEMVRHECAEALGAIATPRCFQILGQYLRDEKRVVRESCLIALDMCDYENNTREFQYANALASSSSSSSS